MIEEKEAHCSGFHSLEEVNDCPIRYIRMTWKVTQNYITGT